MRWMKFVLECVGAYLSHEAGHAIAAKFQGMTIKSFGITRRGLQMVIAPGTAIQNLRSALAGVTVNLLLAAILWAFFPMFALLNFQLALVNLLPIRGSDGCNARKRFSIWRKVRMCHPSEAVEITVDDREQAIREFEAWQAQGKVGLREKMIHLEALNLALQRGIQERQRAIMVLSEDSR